MKTAVGADALDLERPGCGSRSVYLPRKAQKDTKSGQFHLLWLFVFLVATAFAQQPPAANPLNEPVDDPGIVPVGADGKPLNLNFESGNLDGWKVEGKAFEQQPIKGDISVLRPADGKKSEHTGQFWIGGYEKLRDLPQGTLTSATFEVTHPFCSFLVGGGSIIRAILQ